MEDNPYYNYYKSQIGGGGTQYYVSRYGVQRGRGWMGRFIRWLTPLAGQAARAVGQEVVKQGTSALEDIVTSPSEPIARIAQRRGKQGLANLATRAARALSGGGRKRRGGGRRHISSSSGRKRLAPPKSARRPKKIAASTASIPAIGDIFSPP